MNVKCHLTLIHLKKCRKLYLHGRLRPFTTHLLLSTKIMSKKQRNYNGGKIRIYETHITKSRQYHPGKFDNKNTETILSTFFVTNTSKILFKSTFRLWKLHLESTKKITEAHIRNNFFGINLIIFCLFRKLNLFITPLHQQLRLQSWSQTPEEKIFIEN